MSKFNYEKIRDIRLDKDITQKHVAEDLNISRDDYKKIESGQTIPSLEFASILCDYFKVNIEEIYQENYHDTKIIAIMSNKGGVGKTSIASALTTTLASMGNKILVIDTDMQGNMTHSLDLFSSEDKNVASALEEEKDMMDCIMESHLENIDYIPYHPNLSVIETTLFTKNARETLMRRLSKNLIEAGIYDYIILDTSPSLSVLNFNVVTTAHYCIAPVTLGAFGLEGLNILLDFINEAKQFNNDFKGVRFLINNYDRRKKITDSSYEYLKSNYDEYLLKTIVRIDTSIEKAQFARTSIECYDEGSKITQDLKVLAEEIIDLIRN